MTSPTQFLTPLELLDEDGAVMTLVAPFQFYSYEQMTLFVVPALFQTDFASIPQWLQGILPRNGKYDRAAVLHDAGYRGQMQDMLGHPQHLTKAQADDLFVEAMKAGGVAAWQIFVMAHGVRTFGGHAYHG